MSGTLSSLQTREPGLLLCPVGGAHKSAAQQPNVWTHGRGDREGKTDPQTVLISNPLLLVAFGSLWAYVLLQKTEKYLETIGLFFKNAGLIVECRFCLSYKYSKFLITVG